MSHDLATTGIAPPGDIPQMPPDTPRYRFESFLGRGGMAEVWAEKAPKIDRVTCLEFQDLGCGPPSQWSKKGRLRPLREP